MSIDCAQYSLEKCLKGNTIVIDHGLGEIIALACWGVYCQEGQYVVHKKKKDKVETSDVIRGQQSVFRKMHEYVQSHRVSDVFFAGDNIYRKAFPHGQNPTDDEIGFKIDEQLRSFEKCYEPIKQHVDRTFIGIGNHDVENCEILNKELNFFNEYSEKNQKDDQKWEKTGTYFRIVYKNKDNGDKENKRDVTIVMLDTNMYEEGQNTCSGDPYTDTDRDAQRRFVEASYKEAIANGHWIIFMGHIPAKANGHKEKKKIVYNDMLYKLLVEFPPHLYICGDEHNQQFIVDKETGIGLAIVGSGGTDLDPIVYKQLGTHPVEKTYYAESMFGFLSLYVDKHLSVTIISTEMLPSTKHNEFHIVFDYHRNVIA